MMQTITATPKKIQEISVDDLKQMIDEGRDFQLIDVREQWEYDIANIGGELIPMNLVSKNIRRISQSKQVAVLCRSGKRSANVVRMLQNNFAYNNLYNVAGGILEWSDRIDNSITKY